MKYLNMLIKPSSGNCQLRCKYCFYHSLAENNREQKSYGMMEESTLEVMIKKAIETVTDGVNFAFQGGEPTLRGLDFFRKVIELQKKYNKKGLNITNALQTNGIVIDEEWAKFLFDNHFLVGISIDGPKDIHDLNRIDANGNGTFNRVMQTVDLLNKYKVEYNVLFVVTSNVARYVNKIYSFFKKHNFNYIQFIPCLDPLGVEPGNQIYSVTNKRFGKFLNQLFSLYYEDFMAGNVVSIRYFDNLVGMLLGYPPEACGMKGECGIQYVIEADGSVYPCDFYCIDEWKMGNILENSFEELLNSDSAKRFVEVSRHVDPKCKTCKYANICRGGCRRTREPFKDGLPALQYFCPSYIEFFDTSYNKMMQMANEIRRRQRMQ